MLARMRPWKREQEDNDEDEDKQSTDQRSAKKPYALQRPANTALRQQRLKAWQPLLTHATVIPLLFGVGVAFAVLGAVMYWSVLQVDEFSLDYTQCRDLTPGDTPVDMPAGMARYRFHNMNASAYRAPQWKVEALPPPALGNQPSFRCTLYFSVPNRMAQSVFLYYRLTNYYQNHRRYIKNADYDQMLNKPKSPDDLQSGQCKPLGKDPASGLSIYPCGLIANSVFNDTFADPVLLGPDGSGGSPYAMSEKNIVWKDEWKHYKTPTYNVSDIVPPPFWRTTGGPFAFGERYEEGKVFDPTTNEHFQVWMRTAGFPTFRKLYKRNDDQALESGWYALEIIDNYPVGMFDGTKSVLFSTASWIGGRNLEIGASHIAVAALCFLIGIALVAKQLIKPRRAGDLSYLSWNSVKSR
ncbi:hypothetical protein MSPP1_000165 [Malassezia sp. CBS 17886]|nr:hypothetical protein MSPP1_000165 [Malassezia sp. CBS 17886]